MEVGILSEVFVNWTQTKRDEGSCDPGRNMADGQEMVIISHYFFLFFCFYCFLHSLYAIPPKN